MQGTASRTGRYRKLTPKTQLKVRPNTAADIVAVVNDSREYPSPLRPVGANSGNSRCTSVQEGTAVQMAGMNKIVRLTPRTVTVQAGMRLRDLARKLAEHGLELVGSYEQPDRTVGGTVSSGSLSVGMLDDGGHLSSGICGIGLVTPQGRLVEWDESQPEMLRLVRQSYGLLGIIHQVTLRIRKIRCYSVRSRKVNFTELKSVLPKLATTDVGVKIYLLPFRDHAIVETRDATGEAGRPRPLVWKIRDWISNRFLPSLVHSVGRAVPVSQIRDPLIDGFSEATQLLVNARLTDAGSNAMEQTGQFRRVGRRAKIRTCTWLFPAEKFGAVIDSYQKFCRRHYKVTGYRCDLPAVAYRILRDTNSLLSPSFAGPVFALNLRTTNQEGWDNFIFDIAKLANRFDGVPLFNQTKGYTAQQVAASYGQRLVRFRSMRRKIDPEDRFVNQFFGEFIG